MTLTTKQINSLLPAIMAHATQEQPRECCGLIVKSKRKLTYYSCRNLATAIEHFILDPIDYAQAEETGHIIAVVHSHIYVPAEPSSADLVGIEKSALPWLIINWPTGNWTLTKPTGIDSTPPLEGREFVHGIHDCYSIVRDYYRELGITLTDYQRQGEWWLQGQALYRKHFTAEGFIEVPRETLQEHDVLLMRVRSPEVENHAAIYLGNNIILHHLINALSCKTTYEAYWQRHTTAVLRHQSFIA